MIFGRSRVNIPTTIAAEWRATGINSLDEEEVLRRKYGIQIFPFKWEDIGHIKLHDAILSQRRGVTTAAGLKYMSPKKYPGHIDLMCTISEHYAGYNFVTSNLSFMRTMMPVLEENNVKILYIPNRFWHTGRFAWSLDEELQVIKKSEIKGVDREY